MVLIPRSDHVRGMRHVRGVTSAPSLSAWGLGRAERRCEGMNIAAALATLQLNRRILAAHRRSEGARRYG